MTPVGSLLDLAGGTGQSARVARSSYRGLNYVLANERIHTFVEGLVLYGTPPTSVCIDGRRDQELLTGG